MRTKTTKVFLSYARKDEAVAHLLASILRHRKIECLIDRALRAGTKFDTTIQGMIDSADIVLVLLTPSSVSSAWVNQEAGRHSDEYMSVLAEERKLFQQLIDRKRTDFRMILWPVRAYDR